MALLKIVPDQYIQLIFKAMTITVRGTCIYFHNSRSPNKLNATKKPFANLGSPKVNIIQRQYSSPRLEMGNNLNLVHCSKHPEKCA